MKTKNIITAGSILLLAVFFTSCSSTIDIAKRQFNNGYYVHITNKHQVESAAITRKDEPAIAVKNTVEPVVVNENIISPVITEQIVANDNSVVASIANKKPVSVRKKSKSKEFVVTTESTASENNNYEFKKQNFLQRKLSRMADRTQLRGESVPGIILLVLCIFIPPLAVLCLDNHTGGQFWLDLLLWCLGVLPGIVYALWLCFFK